MIAIALLIALAAPPSTACALPPEKGVTDAQPRRHAFQNGGREPLTLAWLNQKGEPVELGTIAPGGHQSVDTWVDHVFTLSDARGRCQRVVRIDDVISGTFVGTSRYRPVTVRSGWHVFADLALDPKGATAAAALPLIGRQLGEIERVLPSAALARIRTTPIYLHDYTGAGGAFHSSPDWLVEHGRTVEMLNGIELSNMKLYVEWADVQPGSLLHELAHRYHRDLPVADQAEIEATYQRAMASGRYRAIKRHDGSVGRAYADKDALEYFAELTEAYFIRNEFFPFTRAELREYDPEGARLVERLWGIAP